MRAGRRGGATAAVWILAGLAVALFWVLPRFAAPVGWGALAACTLLEELGRPLRLSERVLDLSPFAHIPKLAGGDAPAAPLVWFALIAVALAAFGLLGLSRRDVL